MVPLEAARSLLHTHAGRTAVVGRPYLMAHTAYPPWYLEVALQEWETLALSGASAAGWALSDGEKVGPVHMRLLRQMWFFFAVDGPRRGLLHAPLKRLMQKLLDYGRQLRLGRRHTIWYSAGPQVLRN